MNSSGLRQAVLALVLSLPLVGCSRPAPPPVAAAPVEMKNGVPLTAEQIRERDAYIARAALKKRQREQDELKRAQAIAFAAAIQANEFQRRQGLKLDRQEQAQRNAAERAAQQQARRDAAYAVAPPQEQKFQVVPGWDGSAPTPEQRPAVAESYHQSEVVQEDPGQYAPPVAYQNLPPGSGGTRVVQPDYGPRGSAYAYRQPRTTVRSSGGYSGFGGDFSGGYGYSGGSSRSRRGWDGAPKNVHVRSYTKKDGTFVGSHYRRSPR